MKTPKGFYFLSVVRVDVSGPYLQGVALIVLSWLVGLCITASLTFETAPSVKYTNEKTFAFLVNYTRPVKVDLNFTKIQL